jgi:hypothetical protein
MNDVNACPACGRATGTNPLAFNGPGMCPDCAAGLTTAPHVRSRVDAPEDAAGPRYPDLRNPASRGTPRYNGLASYLSGAVVIGLGGAVFGGFLSANEMGGVGFGAALGGGFGTIIGLIIGWRLVHVQSYLVGALFGAILPMLLIVKDALSRGREPGEFLDPQGMPILGGILAGGAGLGMLLVGVKKLLLWLFNGRSRP